MRKASGERDGYKWEVVQDECLGGWDICTYHVEAPDGEHFCANFTEDFDEAIECCKMAIENHQSEDYAD